MQYGLSVKWHNSCGRQKDRKTNRRSSVFFARPKIHSLKTRLFLSDTLRMKKVHLYVKESETDRSGHTLKIRKERR